MNALKIHFNNFFVEKWLPEELRHEEKLDKTAEIAYRKCYQKIRDEKVVSRSILRKWFGIGGHSCPKREQVIKLAFAGHFTVELLQEYLEEGILEPGLQINDYREIIFMYGLENGQSYRDCLDMITLFERCVNQDTIILQKTHTVQLREFYDANRLSKREEFLLWMCGHAEYFKGYSRVALKHFMELKKEIIEYISDDANEVLKIYLKELGYYEWANDNKLKEDDKDNIQRYIRNISKRKNNYIDEKKRKEISDFIRKAYVKKHTNAYLLREIYQPTEKNKCFFQMDSKKLSQLLKVAEHKEKEIKLSWAYSCLSGIEDKKAPCPQCISAMMPQYRLSAAQTVEETEKNLGKYLREQRQCCHLVVRNDLLPMIHYAAYMRYMRENKREKYEYNQQREKKEFIEFANEILSDCQMAELNERYQMDSLLLSAYKETEMNSFADLIEGLGEN